ncbi:MAG TPA: FkbM family methyltransferase [Verrucomicrobiales bacterium]|nr:FkbM family methyltransferase [Verrucomicrobiales bacterium]
MFFRKKGKQSYSQCGEDLLIQFIFKTMKRSDLRYLDIGAHDPVKFNNTFGLYRAGHRGVCIEPNPELSRRFKSIRRGDTCLNIGIGETRESAMDFYVMSRTTLSTFSKEEAERVASFGKNKIEKVVSVPVEPIREILDKHFQSPPDFVSIDVEGMDEVVLNGFDFDQCRPTVFCIETLTFTEDNQEQKQEHIIERLKSCGYMVYADTYINTIFVDRDRWRQRPT